MGRPPEDTFLAFSAYDFFPDGLNQDPVAENDFLTTDENFGGMGERAGQ